MADYITSTELAAYIGSPDASMDAVTLEWAATSASRAVDSVCGRTFQDAGTVSARAFRAHDPYVIEVDDFSTTTGLVIATDDDDTGTFETTWTSSDYELSPPSGVVDGVSGFPYWRIRAIGSYLWPVLSTAGTREYRVQVTAQWGWASVPQLVKQATLIVGGEVWKRKDAPFGVAGFGEFGALRVSADVAKQARGLLTPYIRAYGFG